jgi:hypothetical protein
MYEITKTRMLLTTAVFAAVAAVFAGVANAAIGTAMATQAVATAPAFPSGDELDTAIGTAMAARAAEVAQASIGSGVNAAQAPSWQGKAGKGEETGGTTNVLQRTAPLFTSDDQLDPAIGSGIATRAASKPS